MIFCKELNTEFDSRHKMFKSLKANEDRIISLKKSQIHKSSEKGQISLKGSYFKDNNSIKNIEGIKGDHIYPIINTTKYMDSHMDVHFDGIWNKTISEQQGKIYYVDNHSLKVDDVIAWPEDVRVFTQKIDWSLVGKDFEGETEALIYEIPKDKLKKQSAIDVINEKRNVENSVSMIYVKIFLGINDTSKDFKENKTYYDKRINDISNKGVAEDSGYFWGIEEAKIHKEGSLVLFGSNDATAIVYDNKTEPFIDTQEEEPLNSTHKFLLNISKNYKPTR